MTRGSVSSLELSYKRQKAFGKLRGVIGLNTSVNEKHAHHHQTDWQHEKELESRLPYNMRGVAKPRRRFSSALDSEEGSKRTTHRMSTVGVATAAWAVTRKTLHHKRGSKVLPDAIKEQSNEKYSVKSSEENNAPELVAGSERFQKFKRAKFGVLLSILERSPTGGKYKLFIVFKVLPVLLLFLDFLQLNGFNARALQPTLEQSSVYAGYLTVYDAASFNLGNTSASFFSSLALVLLVLLGIGALTVLFLRNKQRSNLFGLVGGYMTLLTTLIYMPIIKSFTSMFNCDAKTDTLLGWSRVSCGSGEHTLYQFIGASGILGYVPLCMFISQNNFEHDPHGNHILRRPSGRFAVVNLSVKTVLAVGQTFSTTDTNGLYQTWILSLHCVCFTVLLCSFRLLLPYFDSRMNRLHSLFLGAEVVGAINALVIRLVPEQRKLIADTVYPVSLFVISPLFANITFHAYFRRRFKMLLAWLFSFFDLANDPSIPYTLGLDHLLKTATRCGHYADFLHRVIGDEKTAKYFYQHALRADPNHASNLGKNANFCFSTGNITEARALFKRAMQVDPNHVENLGLYARFKALAEKNIRGADELYRKTVSLDPNHATFQGMYSASSDALIILDAGGFILDCNGTALRMFHGSTRDSLLNLMLLDMCYIPPLGDNDQVELEATRLRNLADSYIRTCCEIGTSSFMWTFQAFVCPGDDAAGVTSERNKSGRVGTGNGRRRSFDATAVAEEKLVEEDQCIDPHNRSQFSLAKVQENHRQLLNLNHESAKYAFQAEVLLTLHETGARSYIQASLRDVAKLGKLVEKERQFVSILENLFDAVILVDYFGTIKTINTQTLDLFGFKHAKELEKKNVKLLIPVLESENELSGESKIPKFVSKNEHKNLVGTTLEGSEIPISIRVSMLSTHEKEMKNTYCIIVRQCPGESNENINELIEHFENEQAPIVIEPEL